MPRRAALGVLSALITLQTTPDHLSDLALGHSSPSSHHPKSLSIAPKSQVTPSSLTEGTNGTLMPRRAALSALSALAHSSDLSDRSRPLESPRPKSLSIAPNSPLFEGTHGTLTPRRAALSVLNALIALQIIPEPSSDLALSHSPSPLSHLTKSQVTSP